METAPQQVTSKRSWFAFSLLNLMLGSALLVAVISHVVASRELNTVKAEVRRLRAELGYLDIKDPTKVYVTSVPQIESDSYLIRLYLPPGHQYSNHYRVESHTGASGVSIGSGSSTISKTGEMTFKVKIYRDERGEVRLALGVDGSSSVSTFAPHSATASPNKSSSASKPESNRTEEFTAGDPIKILALDVQKIDDPTTRDVIRIWLQDPAKPLTEEKIKNL